MHAYGHQWACQLVYNPRLCEGLGLTDGEGVERLWSRLRRLIGIERSQWVSVTVSTQSKSNRLRPSPAIPKALAY